MMPPKKMTKKERLAKSDKAFRKAIENDVENMSLDELEAMIAERSKPENLPKWWFKDFRRSQRISDGLVSNGHHPGKGKWSRKKRLERRLGKSSQTSSTGGTKGNGSQTKKSA
jgi:hypothetical protein